MSIICLGCVFAEIRFTLRNRQHRNYDYFLGAGIIFLVKLNNVMRCATYVGTLVTSIFYNTNKVMIMFIMTVCLNIAALLLLMMKENTIMENFKTEFEATGESAVGLKWDIHYRDYIVPRGGDPVPLLIVNLVLPVILAFPLIKVIGSPGLLIKGKVEDED